jgi:hypothetical protein
MGGIGHYNYPQFTLEQKYAWFRSGPGSAAAIQVSDSLKRIAARLDVSDATIGAGFVERRLGTSWEGGAAQAASGAFDRAAVVLASLSTSSLSGGGTAQQYGDSFDVTKKAVAPPESANVLSRSLGDTAAGAIGGFWEAQTDARATEATNRNADLAANDALQRHEDTARQVLAGYQSAAAPAQPRAPAATGAAQGAGAGEAGHGGATSAGASGGGPHGGAAAAAGGGGAAAGGAGGTGRPGTAGGTAAAGAGGIGGAHGATAGPSGTESAGWTPLHPEQVPSPPGISPGPNGAPGPNGGYVPVGGPYVPGGSAYVPASTYGPAPLPPSQRSGSVGGYAGAYRNATADQPLPPRTGEIAPAARPAAGAAAGAGARGPGQGGMAPMGMGGAGAGGRDRDHRNRFYIPEDEPFRVEYDFYVAPPVIGAGAPGDREDPR